MVANKNTEKDTASALGRKAYGDAMAALRVAHKEEFNSLLDDFYRSYGMESPRVRREARAEERFTARVAANEAREARRVAKIAKIEAELAALKGVAADPIF